MLLMSGNLRGVHSNKHILKLFFVVSPPFLVTNLSISPNSSEKNNRYFLSERVY